MHGGQKTAKELELGIEIVYGWFTERGDSILIYKCLLLRAVTSVAAENKRRVFLASNIIE